MNIGNLPNTQYFPISGGIYCYHKCTKENWEEPKMPYHRHDAYEIFLFMKGYTSNYVEHACYHLAHGDILIINPNELHRVVSLDNQVYERAFININKNVIENLSTDNTNLMECFKANSQGERKIIRLTSDQINQFVKLIHYVEHYFQSQEYGSDVLINAHLTQLLVMINLAYKGTAYTAPNVMSELIRDTMLFIKEHIEEPIYLEKLSKQFCLSSTLISREFKKYTGLTLRTYILGERIAHSKNLLLEGKNVSDACYLSGFSDYANYIRSFTKIVGIPPGQYKKVMT